VVLRGRTEDLDRARRLVLALEDRVIALAGRPGIGKSWLLSALCADLETRGLEVWRADLSPVLDDTSIIDTVARELGAAPRGAPHGRAVDRLAALIAQRRVVLAIDHADAPADPAGVAELIARCPRLTLVVASHQPLEVPGAARVILDSLEVPAPAASAQEILSSASVRLFIEVAEQMDAHARFDDAVAPTLGEVCRLLGGLPLAIVLAAARIRMMSPVQLLALLRGEARAPFELGLLAPRSADAGSGGIRDALEATMSMLSPSQRALLPLLAVFEGPFPLGSAASLSDRSLSETVDDLEGLVEARLVEPLSTTSSEPVFDLVPIARAFAREHAGFPAADARLLPYLRQLTRTAAAAEADARVTEEAEWVLILRRDVARAVRLQAAEDSEDAAPFAVDAMAVLSGYAQTAVIGEIVETMIADSTVSRVDPQVQAGLWLWSSRWRALAPDGFEHRELVSDRWTRAMAVVDTHRWPQLALQTRLVAILNAATTRDLTLAARCAVEGRALAASAGQSGWIARFDAWGAVIAFTAGDLEGAVALAHTALERGLRVGDPAAITAATLILRAGSEDTPVDDLTVPSLEEALALSVHAHSAMAEAALLAGLTRRELLARRPHSAAHWCAQRLQRARRRGWTDQAHISIVHAAIIGDMLGDVAFTSVMAAAVHADEAQVLRSLTPQIRVLFAQATEHARARVGPAGFDRTSAGAGLLTGADAADTAIEWLRARARLGEDPGHATHPLTSREHEVLSLLARGLSNKEIALALHLSAKTVMHHSVAIYRKLGVRGRAEATSYAYRNRLLAATTSDSWRGAAEALGDGNKPVGGSRYSQS